MPTANPEIFISYKREDASHAVALRIKAFVEQSLACNVIWDENGLDTGDDIRAYMDRLAQGTYIIFVLSPGFMESPYCMYELARAGSLEHFKKRAFGVVLPGTQLDHASNLRVIKQWAAKFEQLKRELEELKAINPRFVTDKLQSELRVLEEIAVHSSTALFDLADKKWLSVDPAGQYDEGKLQSFLMRWIKPQGEPSVRKPQKLKAEPLKISLPSPIQKLLDDIVRVEGGTFWMGSEEKDARDDEKPIHEVRLSDYQIGKYPVTQAQWEAVMRSNPSFFQGCPDCPVERVTWSDCQEFVKKLNALTGKRFSLPTEAQWEYAARGGQLGKGQNYLYSGSNEIDAIAWHEGNANGVTHPVGAKAPNALGLFDMTGNVNEWCRDRYDANYYLRWQGAVVENPVCNAGESLGFRGGSCLSHPRDSYVSFRGQLHLGNKPTYFGLRIVLD